jgi:predicted DNA-binding transcriptional regulator YafY
LRAQAERNDGTIAPAGTTSVTTDAVPPPRGRLEAAILNAVTRAISSQTGLMVSYQSRSRAEPSMRKVWPHALLFSGTRWHARAYDKDRDEFIDLVLQRILSATAMGSPAPRPPEDDAAWSQWLEVEIIPSRSLSASQAEVVAREFGMIPAGKGWVWKARMRECLVGYFIYLHRLDLPSDPQRLIELKDPALAPLYLVPRGGSVDSASSENS